MATGASTCDLAIILIDARHGVQVQTRRHSFIVSLLGIKHVIVAINKMDLMDYSEERFEEIKNDYLEFSRSLDLPDVRFVPMSALNGDNIVNRSEFTPWYEGQPLLDMLETIDISKAFDERNLRFPVQYVNRPNLNFRGYCGTLTSGIVRKGDEITVLPSGKSSRVKSIVTFDGELEEAFPPMSVTLTLEDEIDISRGDLIVKKGNEIHSCNRFDASLVWMHENALVPGRTYDVKFASARTAGRVTAIRHRININTLEHVSASTLELNEIGRVELSIERDLAIDTYREFGITGAFIIIDRMTNATVGAGMVVPGADVGDLDTVYSTAQIDTEERAARFGQKAAIVSFDSELSDLSTLTFTLEKHLFDMGRLPIITDSLAQAQTLKAAGLVVLCTEPRVQGDVHIQDSALETAALVQAVLAQLKEQAII